MTAAIMPAGRRLRRRAIVLGLPAALAAGMLVGLAGPVAVLLVFAALAVGCATAFAPGVVLAAYLLIPFYKGWLQPFVPVDVTVVLAALNALQVVPLVLESGSRRISWLGVSAWLSVGLLVIAGVLYAPSQRLALGEAVAYWALVVLPILAAVLRIGADERGLHHLLWTLALAGMAIVVLGIAQLSASQRLVVLAMNTIQVGRAALMVPLLGATLLLSDRRPVVALAALALMPASILVAMASGSRGPLLVLVVMAMLAAIRLVLNPRVPSGRRLVIVGAAAVTTACVVILIPTLLPAASVARFAELWSFIDASLGGGAPAAGDTSSGTRVRLFSLAVSLFADRPLLGAGTAGFEALSPIYVGPIEAGAYPHNAVLQFAAEYGIAGVALFLSVVALALLRPLPAGRITSSLRALALFFLLNAMVSGNIVQDRMLWALLLLLLVVDVDRTRQDQAGPSPGSPSRISS